MQDVSKMLSVLTILGGVAVFGVEQYQPTKQPDLVQPVGVIEIYKQDDLVRNVNKGTGVFVSPTQVLTAAHVVDDPPDQNLVKKIRTENGDTYTVTDTKFAKDMDVAVVTVDRPYSGFIPNVSCEAQKTGTELVTVGNPLMMLFLESKIQVAGGRPDVKVSQDEGRAEVAPPPIQQPNQEPGPKKFTRIPPDKVAPQPQKKEKQANLNGAKFFQGPALPGQSGSPIYDKDGNIVGVLVISVVSEGVGFSGLGMYVANSESCNFLKDTIKNP